MMHWRHPPRLPVRLACFVLAILLLWPVPLWISASTIAVQASPFVAICTLLAGWAFGAGIILGLVLSAIAIVRKRWFCRYICPVGLLLDGFSRIGLRKNAWWGKCPSIGGYIVLLTAAGSIAGYPLLLWMDPLAFFSSAFTIRTATDILSGFLSTAGLTFLLLIAITSGDLWCARICPLGATQDFLSGARSLPGSFKDILKSKSHGKARYGIAFSTTRRAFLAVAAGVGLGFLAKRNGRARADRAPLRPPGAIEEDEFAGLCVRCGNCMRACPSKIIRPDTGQAGIAGLLAPTVRYEGEYCLEDCNACTQVCPSGALQNLNLRQKNEYVIGEAQLDPSLCFLVRGVRDCDICVRSCPFDAVQIYWDEDLYVACPVVDQLKCNGCGACEAYCPTGDVKAIRVWKSGTV
ncbi:MAG: 4Fe-4S binding protein [Acidobacteria bacterium]|nr:4Fe-4S binding protein [Acidobacteriota bacterium]